MKNFHDMLRKTITSIDYEKIKRFTSPLYDHFGINHFWYYKITYSGHYSYLGTNTQWNEFCFDQNLTQYFTCLRHPHSLDKGIHLMKNSVDEDYKKVLDHAWKKFKINFNINLVNHSSEGIEAFGFATCFNDPHVEERLLNHLLLLRQFTKIFKTKYQKFLNQLDDYQIDLSTEFGQRFYERPKALIVPINKDKFLRKIGFDSILNLTLREKDVLKLISNGYSAAYIGEQLNLSKKTIENYLSNIKSKLSCDSKMELIQRGQQISSTGYFDS